MESYRMQLTKNGKMLVAVCLILALAVLSLGTEIYLKTQGYIVIKNAKITGDIVYVSPSITGRISSIDIKEGDLVKKGQVLAKLDINEIKYQVDKSSAELQIAKAKLARAQSGALRGEVAEAKSMQSGARASYNGALLQREKLKSVIVGKQSTYNAFKGSVIRKIGLTGRGVSSGSALAQVNKWRKKGLMSNNKYNNALSYIRQMALMEERIMSLSSDLKELDLSVDVAKAELSVADTRLKLLTAPVSKTDIEILKNEVKQASAQYELAKRTMSYAVITAPADGRVMQTSYHDGEVISSGQYVASLINQSKLYVMAYIKQKDAQNIRVGEGVLISMEGSSGESFRGTVKEIGMAAQAVLMVYSKLDSEAINDDKIPVKIAFDYNGKNLVPEMKTKVKIKIVK